MMKTIYCSKKMFWTFLFVHITTIDFHTVCISFQQLAYFIVVAVHHLCFEPISNAVFQYVVIFKPLQTEPFLYRKARFLYDVFKQLIPFIFEKLQETFEMKPDATACEYQLRFWCTIFCNKVSVSQCRILLIKKFQEIE